MAEIKWIKITTNMFDDEKIKLIDAMPERDTIFYIWMRLLVQAGKTNTGGYIFLNENVPYSEEMLSTIFNRQLSSIRLALQTLKSFGMIEVSENNLIRISNWDKHQNIEGMDKVREQNRLRKQKQRAKIKELQAPAQEEFCGTNDINNVTSQASHGMSRDNHATEEEEEIEIEEDNYLLYIDELVNYYCTKAGILPINFKPIEFRTIEELINKKVPVDVIKKGIDEAFEKYRPKFQGEKISSFNYCKPVILGLWTNINAKKKGGIKGGNNKRSAEDELREQGIGL